MRPFHENLAGRLLHRLADALFEHPRPFFYSQLLLTAGCILYMGTHLGFTTHRSDLISADAKYHRDFVQFQQDFQMQDSLVAIVESESRDKNRQFVERLAVRLQREPALFRNTYYKGDLRLMGRKALLFLPQKSLEDLAQTIHTNRPLIETFARANNLQTLFELVNSQLRALAQAPGGSSQETSLARALPALEKVVNLATESVFHSTTLYAPGIEALFGEDQTADHGGIYLSFASGRIYLLTAQAASPQNETKAVARLRELVEETREEVPGVNAGITGEPVLEFDEMKQARRDTDIAAGISLLLSAVVFIYGYHELRRPLMATVSLLIGIIYTLAFAAFTVHRLNILSITLVPILIGLAIDFGVHLIARYEEELRRGVTQRIAMRKALAFTGIGIFTSGFTMASAFFAMMLTDFKGIREMGMVAGAGLLVCLIPMLTFLPVLLVRGKTNAPSEAVVSQHSRRRERIERMYLGHPWMILISGAAFTLFAITQISKVHFDYNLLNLQTPDLAAVDLEKKLITSGSQSLLYCAVTADSLSQAIQLEAKIERLPSVASTLSLSLYLTENQEGKLRAVRALKMEVGTLRMPLLDSAPVDLPALERALTTLENYLSAGLDRLRAGGNNDAREPQILSLRGAVGRLRDAIARHDQQTTRNLAAYQHAVLSDLAEAISIIARQEDRERLRVEDLPSFLRDRFVSRTGKFLIQVYPKGNVWQRDTQETFVRELRTVDPNVTGSPVQFYEYTSMLKESFQKAALYAVGLIGIVVFLHFRNLAAVLLAFLPVLLGFCWTLGLMGYLQVPFNPVNIISLTLIIGIGVTSGIHILNRFAEEANPSILSRSTGKAVLVSALTTMAGFGSLMVAEHQGIASLGAVMLMGTSMCMVASLAFLPAVLTLLNRIGWNMIREKRR